MATPDGSGSHTVVTGGSSGIGAAVVSQLLARGHAVTVLDLDPPSSSSDAGFQRADASDESSVIAAITAATAQFGTITGVVTCHGIRGEFVPALDLDLDRTRRVIDVHVLGTLSVCREVVRRLAGAPASIVTVSSTTAYGGWANQSDYGVAKAGIRQLTENLAIEWAPLGVRVNSIAPGFTRTPMVQDMIDNGYDVGAVEKRTPMGRLAEPDEMAASIVALLCDSTYVTGQCIVVDGGWTAAGK